MKYRIQERKYNGVSSFLPEVNYEYTYESLKKSGWTSDAIDEHQYLLKWIPLASIGYKDKDKRTFYITYDKALHELNWFMSQRQPKDVIMHDIIIHEGYGSTGWWNVIPCRGK
jgi:hypothetical protein